MRRPAAGRLPLAPLQDAYQQSGITPPELCRRLGWLDNRPGKNAAATDSSRIKRVLGLKAQTGGKGWSGTVTTITRENAHAICQALNLDIDELYDQELAAMAECPSISPRCSRCDSPMLTAADRCGLCLEELALGVAA